MKTKLIALLLALAAFVAVHAADAAPGELVAPSDKDAAWLADARTTYPLTTCLVSGEDLGDMGKPVDFIYREAGQPDRLVRFCCKMCVPKFKKEPAKYLAKLTPAAKTDAKPAPQPHH